MCARESLSVYQAWTSGCFGAYAVCFTAGVRALRGRVWRTTLGAFGGVTPDESTNESASRCSSPLTANSF